MDGAARADGGRGRGRRLDAGVGAPGTTANKVCTTQLAGYVPMAFRNDTDNFVWDGRHRLRICISRGTGGWVWGSVRLDGPYDPGNGTHDRFTGGWTVQLQGCTSIGLVTLAKAYDAAGVSGSRWVWTEVFTNNKPPDFASYRVWARSAAGALVPRSTWGWSYALSAAGLSGSEYWYGPCMTV